MTGGSSLADALTFGDIDLHLRTPEEGFDLASEAMSRGYAVVHQEIWQHGLATFEIASDPGLLTAYNEMKRRHRGSDPAAYRAAKSDFFAGLIVEPAKSQP